MHRKQHHKQLAMQCNASNWKQGGVKCSLCKSWYHHTTKCSGVPYRKYWKHWNWKHCIALLISIRICLTTYKKKYLNRRAMFLLNIKILLTKVKKMNEKPDPARPSHSLTSDFSETMKDRKLKFWWPNTSPPGSSPWRFPPRAPPPHGQFPPRAIPPPPPDHSPIKKYTWKQRCLALREICR